MALTSGRDGASRGIYILPTTPRKGTHFVYQENVWTLKIDFVKQSCGQMLTRSLGAISWSGPVR